ncbi:hypothetical protein NQZ68_008870, partial [Dissostichus eleginoides]
MYRPALVALAVLLCSSPFVHGGKVLVVPLDGSHWINMKVLVEELHSRGHKITVLRSSDSMYIKQESPYYESITMDSSAGFNKEIFGSFTTTMINMRRRGASLWSRISLEYEMGKQFSQMHKNQVEMVGDIFENTQLMQSLNDAKYDLVLTDPGLGGGVFLGHRLGLPLVFNAADIWLMRNDFTFEFPRPTMPNIVYMSGFQCKPSKPLSKELEDFVQSSGEHGVIVMTLGTLVAALPEDITEEIAAAFAQLPQKVIWRHKGKRPSTLGNNTLLLDWLPQNELLGHPKTKLFVAHGGTNGIQEAIYHGVPLVGLPLMFDQPDNFFRMKARGVAQVLDIATVNKDNFLEVLKEVLYDPTYREKMRVLSNLHRDQPMKPLDKAMFWIEFVMRNKGAAHLRTESYKMSKIQYHSIDVALVSHCDVQYALSSED